MPASAISVDTPISVSSSAVSSCASPAGAARARPSAGCGSGRTCASCRDAVCGRATPAPRSGARLAVLAARCPAQRRPAVTGAPQLVACERRLEPGADARCARRARAARRCSRPPPSRSPARSARSPSPAARRAGDPRRVRRVRLPRARARVTVCHGAWPCACMRRRSQREALLAVERQVHEAEHVGRGQERRERRRPPTATGGRRGTSRTGSRPSRRSRRAAARRQSPATPIRNVQ